MDKIQILNSMIWNVAELLMLRPGPEEIEVLSQAVQLINRLKMMEANREQKAS